MDQKFIELLLGTVFVSVHAYDRFNTPPTNRASTTALRYHTAAVSYFSVYLLIYFLISKYPSLLGVLFVDDGSGVAKEAGSVVKTLQELSPPLLVALLLTVLLPKIPILSNLDNWLRTNLQERAAIPHEARRMSRELRNAEFKVSPNVRDKIQKIMAADGFKPENIVFDECYRPEHQWVKIAVLMAHLESEWESDRKFAGYIHSFSEDYRQLRENYKRLSTKAKFCFRLGQEVPSKDEDQQTCDAISECMANYKEQCGALLNDLCGFISRGVLKCHVTDSTRWHALHAMGFSDPGDAITERLTINQVLALLVIIAPILLLNFALYGSHLPETILLMGTMIATLYTVAVVCALYPKNLWKFTRRDAHGSRPILFYLLTGFAAVALAVPISLMFKFLIYAISTEHTVGTALPRAWEDFSTRSYPWMLMSFITAFFTAFHTDNKPFWKITSPRLRWFEGISQAAVNAAAALSVIWWIGAEKWSGRLSFVLVTAAAIGFVIGFVVPHWYREATQKGKAVPDAAKMPVSAKPPEAKKGTPGKTKTGKEIQPVIYDI